MSAGLSIQPSTNDYVILFDSYNMERCWQIIVLCLRIASSHVTGIFLLWNAVRQICPSGHTLSRSDIFCLRNSLIPVITYLGPVTAGIITGSFVVESTFSIPGLGKYFVQSIMSRDYPIIMATTVVLSALVIVMNLVVDIAYKIVDPRITLTSKED